MSAGTAGPWVILVLSSGHGNNRVYMRGGGPQYFADQRETWDAGWHGRLNHATKVYKRKANAERALREMPDVQGEVVEDPRKKKVC